VAARRMVMVSLVVLSGLAACRPPEPSGERMTTGGGCGEVTFWALSASGELAVTVSVDVRHRSSEQPTTVPVAAGDPDVSIGIMRGHKLRELLCNDAFSGEAVVTWRGSATAGRGYLTVDPWQPADWPEGWPRCGGTGVLHLTGLVAGDGTRFAPLDVQTHDLGCYPG
jgi:hypothetical protein